MITLTVNRPSGKQDFVPGVFRKMKRLFDVQDEDQDDTDQIGVCWTKNAGNCSGVQNWFWLDDPAERALIERVNTGIDSVSWQEKKRWAVWERPGGIYYSLDRDTEPWKDTSLVFGSKSNLPGEFNQVRVVQSGNAYTGIETIPVLPNYDHLSVDTHPWLFHRIWVTNSRGITYDTPKGIFWKPLFSPIGRIRSKGDITGFWVRERYLGDEIK